MTLRPYSPSDKPKLLNLMQLLIPRYFAEAELEDFATYLDHELEDYFVVEDAGETIACGGINYFPEDHKARISWDMVHPAQQGKGVGRKLVEHRLEQIYKTPGLLLAEVRTTQLVYPFYQRLGFELEKVEKDFWAPGFDLYQMIRRLS